MIISRLLQMVLFHSFFMAKQYSNTEKAMAPHSSTLAWKIPWTEETGRLQSMGLLRVRHDWATSLSFSLSCIGEGNGNPLQCSCLENPRDGGAWWAAVYGVARSQTRLKRLSSSSSIVLLVVAEFSLLFHWEFLQLIHKGWLSSHFIWYLCLTLVSGLHWCCLLFHF